MADPPRCHRRRPQLATTVSRETLDALRALTSHADGLGDTLDDLVWYAIERRLGELAAQHLGCAPMAAWEAPVVELGAVDRALVELLVREGRRVAALDPTERSRLAVALRAAHVARRAMAGCSAIEDVVRLFVATVADGACGTIGSIAGCRP
jgi:hypothetical protein